MSFQLFPVFESLTDKKIKHNNGMFKCIINKHFINIKYTCDGFYDCFDHSDEENCSMSDRENKTDKFQCFDKSMSVGLQLVCDFITDCPDGSDEINCGKKYYLKNLFSLFT